MHPEEWEKPVLNDAADTCCVSHDREKQSDESPDEHVRDRDAVQLLKKTSRPRGTLSNIADDCREGSKKRQENDGAHYTSQDMAEDVMRTPTGRKYHGRVLMQRIPTTAHMKVLNIIVAPGPARGSFLFFMT
eukprot:1378910-Amorphochlora_amoeboformis.AAC.1